MSYETKPETIEFILAQIQDELERQYRQEQTLNGQVMQMLAGSTLAAALFGLSFSLEHLDAVTAILYAAGFIMYLVTSLLTFRNLSVNLLRGRPQATLLSPESCQMYVEELSQKLLLDVERTYCDNAEILKDKVRGRTFLICAVVVQFQLFIFGAFFDFLARAASQISGNFSFLEQWPGVIIGITTVLAIIFSLYSFVLRSVPKKMDLLFASVAILFCILMLSLIFFQIGRAISSLG